jgi:hypothetical protein
MFCSALKMTLSRLKMCRIGTLTVIASNQGDRMSF